MLHGKPCCAVMGLVMRGTEGAAEFGENLEYADMGDPEGTPPFSSTELLL